MRKLLLALVLLLVGNFSYSDTIGANVGVTVTAVDAEDLTAATGTAPFDYSLLIGTNGASTLTWQTIYSAAPTSITVLLQGSTDCSTFATIDTSTSNAGEIRSVFGSWKCVRINNTAVAGGAGKTLTVKFVYSTGRVTGTVGSGIFVGGTFTSPIYLVNGTVALPGLAFASDPDTGLYATGTNYLGFSVAGALAGFISTGQFGVNGRDLVVNGGVGHPYGLGFSENGTPKTMLFQDAANTLALKNGGTVGTPVPQTFNIYNFCDGAACATGYERLKINQNTILPESAGTGSANLNLTIGAIGTGLLLLRSNGATRWYLNGGGNILPNLSDTYQIGAPTFQASELYISRSIQGSKLKALTDAAAAVPIERVAVPTNGYAGQLTSFTANSTDGTNRLTTTGLVSWAGADTAGTPTCGTPVVVALSTAYKRANTLICTFTNVVSATNCDLSVTCTDNLAGVQTMDIEHFIVSMPHPNTYTPQ